MKPLTEVVPGTIVPAAKRRNQQGAMIMKTLALLSLVARGAAFSSLPHSSGCEICGDYGGVVTQPDMTVGGACVDWSATPPVWYGDTNGIPGTCDELGNCEYGWTEAECPAEWWESYTCQDAVDYWMYDYTSSDEECAGAAYFLGVTLGCCI